MVVYNFMLEFIYSSQVLQSRRKRIVSDQATSIWPIVKVVETIQPSKHLYW